MKAKITKASDWNYETETEVSTLEDLIALMDKYECSLVVGIGIGKADYLKITIYDDYIE